MNHTCLILKKNNLKEVLENIEYNKIFQELSKNEYQTLGVFPVFNTHYVVLKYSYYSLFTTEIKTDTNTFVHFRACKNKEDVFQQVDEHYIFYDKWFNKALILIMSVLDI